MQTSCVIYLPAVRRRIVKPQNDNIDVDMDTKGYTIVENTSAANQSSVQIFVSDNKSKPQPTGKTHK